MNGLSHSIDVCAARLFHESEHLEETPRIDRKHQEIEKKGRDGAAQRTENGEERAADHVRNPQRHHCLRQQSGDKEDRAGQSKHVGQGDVVHKDFEQAVEDSIPGDIVGVETHLDQDFGNPEVVGRRIENAIQHAGRVCPNEHSVSPKRWLSICVTVASARIGDACQVKRRSSGEQESSAVGRTTSAGEVRGRRYSFRFLIMNS
jgi:hypothetical protein